MLAEQGRGSEAIGTDEELVEMSSYMALANVALVNHLLEKTLMGDGPRRAATHFRSDVDVYKEFYGKLNYETSKGMANLGLCLMYSGGQKAALPVLIGSAKAVEAVFCNPARAKKTDKNCYHPDVANAYTNLGGCYKELGLNLRSIYYLKKSDTTMGVVLATDLFFTLSKYFTAPPPHVHGAGKKLALVCR